MNAENSVGLQAKIGMKVPIYCPDVKLYPFIAWRTQHLQKSILYPVGSIFKSNIKHTMFC